MRYTDNHHLTDTQIKELQGAFDKLLEREEASEEYRDIFDAAEDYVDKNGIPDTAEHGVLVHEDLDDYIEDHGMTYEDFRCILLD